MWNPTRTWTAIVALTILTMIAVPAEARYSAVVHQAQSQLAAQGHDPGVLDGFMGPNTRRAIVSYQTQEGLSPTGELDSATLESLSIGVSVDLARNVEDWQAVPTQAEIDELKEPINSPSNPYADYRPRAPGAKLGLPGKSILAAMNLSADTYGGRPPNHPKHTQQGLKALIGCLRTTHFPDHWSDITIHYYCQMSLPRRCFTNALAGKSTGGRRLARPVAYEGCSNGRLADAGDFRFVTTTQPEIFQYLMFAQTHAFDHEQEQAIINAFYGVEDPTNRNECTAKRPQRTEDPSNGTHCLVDKEMNRKLVGRSR
ncbi:MAG: peptidoglycan-binding protein [Ruegeria sp.]|uniref:peptidoglycan-binding domain-containing protein n=1 Tax=Ruegeria sp. TaxID=1879320 RepID=UPI00349EF7B0